MEEKEPICIIPRNLNKPDTIIHSPIELNWKQIAYIGTGVAGAYLAFQTGLPHVYKIVLMVGSFSIGIIASMIKYEDSTLDEMVVDSLYYVQRKNIYKQLEKRGDLIVNLQARKEDSTVDIKSNSFTVPTA